MNTTEFKKIMDETIERIQTLSNTKGEEYAGSEDRLGNFKRNGERIDLDPLQIWHVYASKHYDSICTYIKDIATGKVRERSELLEGRADDLILYLILFKALVADRAKQIK